MAGTIVTVFIDATDTIRPDESGLSLSVVAARPGGHYGIGDDWRLAVSGPRPIEAVDRLIEALQEVRRRELARLVNVAGGNMPEPAPV